ncbi:hypothetical protein GC176_22600 [bacterium]|nr:hypothetical protein [bacterium]
MTQRRQSCLRAIPLYLAATLLCLATSLAVADDMPSAQRGPRSWTIVTLGDSITKGVRSGVTPEQTFASLVGHDLSEAGVESRVINVGIGGERTDQALRRLDQVIELKPDIVTVMYGTNDSYIDRGKSDTRITLDAYRANLTMIVSELLRRGITPVLMTEPRWSDKAGPNGVGENPNVRLEPYVEACRQIAHEWRVPLVDHFAKWTASRADGVELHDWTTDGCHPNPAGHRELATLMLPELRQAMGPALTTREKLVSGEPVRIVCFGDSVTGVYYHTGSRRAYTDMLEIALRRSVPNAQVQMTNAGISGHTTVNALARIDRDVLSQQPDLVTVMFGLNDMTRVPIDDYRANLVTIVRKCREGGAEVVLATPNAVVDSSGRPTTRLIEYCDVVRDVGRELNVAICDCYRELEATRSHDVFDWRLLMSDAIHPNMDGHKRIAISLAQSITGQRVALDDVMPTEPVISHTLARLRGNEPVRVLAMPPFDKLIEEALHKPFPNARVEVSAWSTEGLSLASLEQDAKSRVRAFKPDLVLIAIPRSASDRKDESFAGSYAWVMNWSLNFGSPTWDCIVAHPSLFDSGTADKAQDDLVRRLVHAQDLTLIDREAGSTADAATILQDWLQRQLDAREQ